MGFLLSSAPTSLRASSPSPQPQDPVSPILRTHGTRDGKEPLPHRELMVVYANSKTQHVDRLKLEAKAAGKDSPELHHWSMIGGRDGEEQDCSSLSPIVNPCPS